MALLCPDSPYPRDTLAVLASAIHARVLEQAGVSLVAEREPVSRLDRC